jgi:hypothetical protein
LVNGYRDHIGLRGKLAASLSGCCIISASRREEAIGLGGKRIRARRVGDNRAKHRARAVIGVPGMDETPEAPAVAIAGFLQRGAA